MCTSIKEGSALYTTTLSKSNIIIKFLKLRKYLDGFSTYDYEGKNAAMRDLTITGYKLPENSYAYEFLRRTRRI